MSGAAKPFCPYKGLQPYGEEDYRYFFGREQDSKMVASNMLASRLTILYGPSGVGKSSMLRAGVAPILRSLPDTSFVSFRKWQGSSFEIALFEEIAKELPQLFRDGIQAGIGDLLKVACQVTNATIAIIFDQFEDYLLYHSQNDSAEFEASIAEVVNDNSLDAHFLFALREESLAGLDRLRIRIPGIFGNVLRLDHLDRASAARAIRGPLERYNGDHASQQPIEVEEALVNELLDQVRRGNVLFGEAGKGGLEQVLRRSGDRIETPYLQLALTHLWEEEARQHSKSLRVATLDQLGGAEKIANSHLERVLGSLGTAEQAVCLNIFDRLVTPSGAKIAYTSSDLAVFAHAPEAEVRDVLEDLSSEEKRILRAVAAAPHGDRPTHYEICHDVLAKPILRWREQKERQAELFRAEQEAAQQRLVILDCSDAIEGATRQLFRFGEVIARICATARSKFDFAAVQLLDRYQQTIQTVYGDGLEPDWYTIAKHSLESAAELRDIQADVALSNPPRIEIIAGKDPRFDLWIFESFAHANKVRVFCPILLVRDKYGVPIVGYLKQCRWREIIRQQTEFGRRIAIEICIDDLLGPGGDNCFEIIGTIEAGYYNMAVDIPPDAAADLFKEICQHAPEMYSTSLAHICQTVADSAKRIVNADAASLHFPFDPQRNRYVYEAWAGPRPSSQRPRKGGLGERAINRRSPMFLPDRDQGHGEQYLSDFNPSSYKEGMRALAAIPLFFTEVSEPLHTGLPNYDLREPEKHGILYVTFNHVHWFSRDEIRWLQLFANRATDAIRHATHYTTALERARRLAALHKVALSLAEPDAPDLLQNIAGNALNLLAADLVTIYEYDPIERIFPIEPNVAGRLKAFQKTARARVDSVSAPSLLVQGGTNIYLDDVRQDKILYNCRRRPEDGKNFVDRESVVSSAGILLKTDKQTVGAMFVNYRRPHRFPPEEKWFIERLAETAAIALRNRRRWYTAQKPFTTQRG